MKIASLLFTKINFFYAFKSYPDHFIFSLFILNKLIDGLPLNFDLDI
jgi:hypothetical protein